MKLQNNYPSSFQPKSDESSSDKARAYNACCTNDVSTLSQLLEERRIFPRADKDSVCPETLLLHAAAANNAVDCLKALLKKGWQVDDTVQVDKDDSWTPLREAAKSSSPDAAKVLTERGAQVSLKVIDALYTGVSEAENPTALGTDRKEVMKVLVDVLTLERGEADAKRFDSIWKHAISNNQVSLAKSIHPHALSTERAGGDLLTVCMADPRPSTSTTPSSASSDAIFDLLLSAYICSDYSTLSYCALTHQSPRAFAILERCSEYDFGSPDASFASLANELDRDETHELVQVLVHAIEGNNSELIDELIRRGVSPNWRTRHGLSGLYQAVGSVEASPETLQRLLAADAAGDARLRAMGFFPDEGSYATHHLLPSESSLDWHLVEGNTPLHALAETNHVNAEIVKKRAEILLAAGADVNARNGAGKTPLQLAKAFGQKHRGGTTKTASQALEELLKAAGGIQ